MFQADQDGAGSGRPARGIGIDLNGQKNVTLDLDERPNEGQRICAPIEVPDRVVLVIQPIGGPDNWRALFHEGSSTEHFARRRATSRWRRSVLGDNAVTEGWAMLLASPSLR